MSFNKLQLNRDTRKAHANKGIRKDSLLNYITHSPDHMLDVGPVPPLFKKGGSNMFPDGGVHYNTQLSSADSLNHQRDKTIQYEVLKGDKSGSGLPYYNDPAWTKKYDDEVKPRLGPYKSAMEKGEAGDFIYNTGKNPQRYALQEYYRKNEPALLDEKGDWANRNGLSDAEYDKLYKEKIGSLPENERRVLMNLGRDWYYKNSAPKGDYDYGYDAQGNQIKGEYGEWSPAYQNTWYGRIHNTNDFSEFDPNNPAFNKQDGGQIMELDDDAIEQYRKLGYTIEDYAVGGEGEGPLRYEGEPAPNYQAWELPAQPEGAPIPYRNEEVIPPPVDPSQYELPQFDSSLVAPTETSRQDSSLPREVPSEPAAFPEDVDSMEDFNNWNNPRKEVEAVDQIVTERPYEHYEPAKEYLKTLDDRAEKEKIDTTEDLLNDYKRSTKGEIISLQQSLKEDGYYLGEYGVNKDGIDGDYGTMTRSALKSKIEDDALSRTTIDKYYNKYKDKDEDAEDYKNRTINIQKELVKKGHLSEEDVDGKFGDVTRDAVEIYNNNKNPDAFFFSNIPKTLEIEQCAKGMCQIMEQNDVKTTSLGVKYQNAWDIKENMDKMQNSTEVYNIYDNPKFKNVNNAVDLVRTTWDVKKDNQTNASMYKTGDVVGIFYPASSHHSEVLNSKTYNTHVGFVSGIENGVPMVTHNISGTVITEPYSNLNTGWIQRPNADMKISEMEHQYDPEPTPSAFEKNPQLLTNFEAKKGRTLSLDERTIVSNVIERASTSSQNLPKLLNSDIDSDWLEAAVVGIAGVESSAGINAPRSRENIEETSTLQTLAYAATEKADEDISLGVTKTKFNSLDKFSREYFDIKTPEDLGDDNKAIDNTTYTLIKYHDSFKNYALQYPELGLTDEDIKSMTLLAHNRGDKKLLTLGRRTDNKSDDSYYEDSAFKSYIEEIQSMRNQTTEGSYISDVSATKYKHFDKIGLKGVGQKLYNLENPEGHETYVSKVKRYMTEVYGYGVEQPIEEGEEEAKPIAGLKRGGEYHEVDLDEAAIEQYKKMGYHIEEI